MKKINVFFITILLVTVLTASVSFGIDSPSSEVQFSLVHVKVEGACEDEVCGYGYKINGVSYIPVRMVMESLGAEVLWDQQTQTVQVIKKTDKESDQVQIFRDQTKKLLNETEKQIELFKLIDQQLQLAYEIYKETGETQWMIMNQNLIAERKKSVGQLSNDIMEHVEEFMQHTGDAKLFFDLSDNLKQLATQYEFAEKSLQSYAIDGKTSEYKNYLLYRRYALDLYEKLLILTDKILNTQE